MVVTRISPIPTVTAGTISHIKWENHAPNIQGRSQGKRMGDTKQVEWSPRFGHVRTGFKSEANWMPARAMRRQMKNAQP